MARRRPLLISARVDESENQTIQAWSRITGRTVTDLIRAAVFPVVKRDLTAASTRLGMGPAPDELPATNPEKSTRDVA